MKENRYAVMLGDPASGFYFHGPFDRHDDAIVFAERHLSHTTWWTIELHAPAEMEKLP